MDNLKNLHLDLHIKFNNFFIIKKFRNFFVFATFLFCLILINQNIIEVKAVLGSRASSANNLNNYNEDKIKFESPWTWKCVDGFACQRELFTNNTSEKRVSLNVCWLTCGFYGPLWPFPTVKTQLGRTIIPFYPQNVAINNIYASHISVKAMIGYSGNLFLDALFRKHPKSDGQSVFPNFSNGQRIEENYITLSLTAHQTDVKQTLTTDESYQLTITPNYRGIVNRINVEIVAPTFFGLRHGLETLSQLIAYDENNECLQIVSEALIQDKPAFAYRGIMIDTGRNFIPVEDIKKVIDGMSYNKMNMLHWHMTDTNSFPFYSKRVPQMTKFGAYGEDKIYTPKDIRELILYAKLRSVKIIPELDAPAHAGNGWQWGELEGYGKLALCINAEPWRNFCGQPSCGQLNPLNNNTYLVIGEIYKDLLDLFDRDVFHMGGDEVYFSCWYTDDGIREWQRSTSTDLMELWGEFQNKAHEKLKEANGNLKINPIVWTSDMTKRGRKFLDPNDYIIQIWVGANDIEVRELLEEKYKVIFSNLDSAYLDHGFGSWLGQDHFWTYKTWQQLYDNDLVKIAEYHLGRNASRELFNSGQILGGEATLWSEKVDENNIEMKLWPRSCAMAERLWSNPINRTRSVYPRMIHHRNRMSDRGIRADRLQPESCHQISGYCNDPYYNF